MFKRTEALTKIADALGAIKSSCEHRGLLHLFDNHTVAQHFFRRLLNAVFDLELVELDHLKENFPSIDLGDTKKRIAYQVTTQKDSQKVTKTLAKFDVHKLDAHFDKLKILVIGERQKTYDAVVIPDRLTFSMADDIIDIPGLLKYIGTLETAYLEKILLILSEEIDSPLKSVSTATILRPPPRNPKFAGREEDIEELHSHLVQNVSVGVVQQTGVHAHGGVGKTAVAIEYGWRCFDENASSIFGTFPGGVVFLSCDVDDIRPTVALLARRLGVRDVFSQEDAIAAVKRHFENGQAALFILDNVRDGEQWASEAFQNTLPGHPCRRLITTRAEALPDVQRYPLGGLDAEDGIELLAKYRPDANFPENRAAAGEIVRWFNGLAVGLVVAGVYMSLHVRERWQSLWDKLNKRGLEQVRAIEQELLLRHGGSLPLHHYHKRVESVFEEALASLDQVENLALSYAALCPEDIVPTTWLITLLGSHISANKPGDDVAYAQIIVDRLTGLQLLTQRDDNGEVLSVHRVLREQLLARMERTPTNLAARRAMLWELIQNRCLEVDEPVGGEPITEVELGAILALIPAIVSANDPITALKVACYSWGALEKAGRFAEMRESFASLDQSKDQFVKDPEISPLYRLHLTHLGGIARYFGDRERALEYFRAAFRTSNPEPTELTNLALALRESGQIRAALRFSFRALQLERRRPFPHKLNLAKFASNASMCAYDDNRLVLAVKLGQSAISILEADETRDDEAIAIARNNVAMCFLRQGKCEAAAAEMEAVLMYESSAYKPDDSRLGDTHGNLAFAYQHCEQWIHAETHYHKAIDILTAKFGFDSDRCLILYSNFIPVLLRLRRKEQGKRAAEASLRIIDKPRDSAHPNAGSVYVNASEAYHAMGDDARAAELLGKAVKHDTDVFGPKSDELARTLVAMAGFLEETGDWAGAAKSWLDAARIEQAQRLPRPEIIRQRLERADAARTRALGNP